MDKMETIITELTELTKSNKIHWKPKFEGYVVCEDFQSVEYTIFNAMTSVFELCKAVEAQIGEKIECDPEEKFILDVCLADIADFKNRS